jgi:hypothetical protein
VGPANDRFQKKNELFRKHGRRLADGLLRFRLGWWALNSITYPRATQPQGRSSAPGSARGRRTTGQRNWLDRSRRRRIFRK